MEKVKFKKPPSHVAGIVLYGLFIMVGIMSAQNSVSKFNTPIHITLIFPGLFSVGLYGLIRVRRWSRAFCSLPIGLFIIAFISIPFINKSNPDAFYPNLFLGVVIAGLLSWWLFSFAFGKSSKDYFKNKNT
ncbi:MAG: hypothetical protein OEV42_03335 [Deltaproteobacteria bacterium]|nr:hypothetical protein [Deltaproteobacteria bacterium]